MFAEIKKLFSHSVIYGLGNYSTRVIGFFLIPVYTRYLIPADYGALGLATMVSSLLFIFLNMGQSSAFFRSYFEYDDEAGKKLVISTSILLTLAYCLPLAGFLLLGAKPLSTLVFGGGPIYGNLFILVCLATVSRVFLRIPFAIFRAQEKSKQYAVLSVMRGLLGIGIALVLVIGFGQGVSGILWSQFASQFAFCILLLPGVVRGLTLSFSKPTAMELLAFGAPHVPTGISVFVLNLSDRYFLKHYSTLHEVGLYSLGYNFGEVLWLLVTALQLAYAPLVLANMKSPHAPALYARVTTYYFTFMSFIGLGLVLFSPEIVRVMAAPSYYDAYRVIPLIALAQIFHGYSLVGPVGLTIKRKPIYRTLGAFVAAGVNLLLNYLWIPAYGMMGAAAATAVSFMVQSFIVTGISLWFYPIAYEYRRLAKVGLVSGAIFLTGSWLSPGGALLSTLPFKAALLGLFPCVLLGLRFFDAEELKFGFRLMRAVNGRLGLLGTHAE